MVVFALGAIGGFGSGFASLRHARGNACHGHAAADR